MSTIDIYDTISQNKKPFIIAEIGVNFYDIAEKMQILPMDAAKLMISKACESGADAVKFQSYKAETIASKNSPAYWDLNEESTTSQFELFKKFDKFSAAEYEELADYSIKEGIVFLSTPFDFESVDYLSDLVPIMKISSSDITNLPFIEYIAKKQKPIFLSTGASTIGEIDDAVNTILACGNEKICLMHCILDYPTDYSDANLNMIKHLQQIYPDFLIGYSDHTKPDESMLVLTASYMFGAKVIEKHFTLDKTLKGNDHYHAMAPQDLQRFVNNINLLNNIQGEFKKHPLDCEKQSRKQARRSIVAKAQLNKGDIISMEKIAFKRPGTGISPKYLHLVIGREVKKVIEEDEILLWDYLI